VTPFRIVANGHGTGPTWPEGVSLVLLISNTGRLRIARCQFFLRRCLVALFATSPGLISLESSDARCGNHDGTAEDGPRC